MGLLNWLQQAHAVPEPADGTIRELETPIACGSHNWGATHIRYDADRREWQGVTRSAGLFRSGWAPAMEREPEALGGSIAPLVADAWDVEHSRETREDWS